MLSDLDGFSVNDAVRFTQDRLSVLTAQDCQRLAGRVGVIQDFYKGAKTPHLFPSNAERDGHQSIWR